ncbi:hypothetical protein [Vreelandella alkaliphila]|uniref:Uncharacterized protein n=1 Tax=Vreelandella alkaliphila TaxID=272774 RepID=A0AAJ2VN01_9GAMM|nr:hypothetical protein [Halomonas alkaliphila]MDX5976153.1 hypothetical protein [Halomonas alkaliphila]
MLLQKVFKFGAVWAFFLIVPMAIYSMRSPTTVDDYVACAAVRVMYKDEPGVRNWLDLAIDRASEDGQSLYYHDLIPALDAYVEKLLQSSDRKQLMRVYIDRCR